MFRPFWREAPGYLSDPRALSRPRARSFPPRATPQLAKATADGVLISDPYELETNWDSASFVLPKAGSANDDGGW